jgi:hypothetical protein
VAIFIIVGTCFRFDAESDKISGDFYVYEQKDCKQKNCTKESASQLGVQFYSSNNNNFLD